MASRGSLDALILRLSQLLVGLVLYGVTIAFLVRSGLGLDPWDVFHEGVALHIPWSMGAVIIATSVLVLVLWIPLRQRPGIGTLLNVVIVGLAVDVTLAVLPEPEMMGWRVVLLLAGVVGNGFAAALYVGANLGPGPRDGLWVGLVRVTGRSVRVVRTGIEGTVLLVGWLLGGTVGIGTVLYALTIGPIVQFFLPLVSRPTAARR